MRNLKRYFNALTTAFAEVSILSIPVVIYFFLITIKIYTGLFAEMSIEMSLMSIIYYSDSVLVAKRINHNSFNLVANVCIIVLIILSSSLFTLELLANGTKTAVLVFRKSSGEFHDMQLANDILLVGGFILNFFLRILVDSKDEPRTD